MMLDTAPRTVTLPNGRVVGFRAFGDGPPVVLLHASPRSAAALLPLGEQLADSHTVFAFDTPGFGWSEALRVARPDAADYADGLLAAFDALGIARAPIYGSHTGAAIAAAAAARHPGRVPALALDGYPVFTPAEQAEHLASYLPPIRPSWDGAHLAFIWSRVKDQFTVHPWHLNAHSARVPRPLPSADILQAVVVDFLAAGDDYRPAYAAAFRFDGLAGLRGLTVPAAVMARSDDSLFDDLDAVQDVPDCITVQRLSADPAAWAAAVRQALGRGGPGHAAPPAPGEAEMRVEGGLIGLRRSASPGATGKPILLLPPIPGSARGEAALSRALAAWCPVHTADLPGFGVSTLAGAPDAQAIAHALAAAARHSGLAEYDIVAWGESASIACLLRTSHPGGGLVLLHPVPDAERGAVVAHAADVTPRRDGTHLLAAWHQLRDASLWRPWFATDPAHAVDNGTDPDVPRLHAILTDWMRGGPEAARTLAAAMAVTLSEVLPHDACIITPPPERHACAAAILHSLSRKR